MAMIDTMTVQRPTYVASSATLPIIEGGMISALRYSVGRIVVRKYDEDVFAPPFVLCAAVYYEPR